MKRDFESILDECLQQLNRGQADMESCLARYPEQAAALRPLLQTASLLRAAPVPRPSPAAKATGRQQLLLAVARRRQAQAQARYLAPPEMYRGQAPFAFLRSWGQSLAASLSWLLAPPKPARALAWVAAVLLILAVSGAGVVGVAARSSLDSPLYPVRLVSEQVQLFLTPGAEAKARRQVSLTQQHLAEIEALRQQGRLDSGLAGRAEALLSDYERALQAIPTSGVPADVQQEIQEMLQNINTVKQNVQQAQLLPPTPRSTLPPKDKPTATLTPSEVARPVAMPTPKVEPTFTPKVEPTPTPPWGAFNVPTVGPHPTEQAPGTPTPTSPTQLAPTTTPPTATQPFVPPTMAPTVAPPTPLPPTAIPLPTATPIPANPVASNLHMSSSAGGGAVPTFPAGTGTVYAVFNYSNFTGQKIGLRVHDAQGQELFDSGLQPYQGSGTQSFAVSAPGGAFPAGRYLTVLYGGEFGGTIASIFWQVEAASPTPAPKSGGLLVMWVWLLCSACIG
jgi:hypothetical protein